MTCVGLFNGFFPQIVELLDPVPLLHVSAVLRVSGGERGRGRGELGEALLSWSRAVADDHRALPLGGKLQGTRGALTRLMSRPATRRGLRKCFPLSQNVRQDSIPARGEIFI